MNPSFILALRTGAIIATCFLAIILIWAFFVSHPINNSDKITFPQWLKKTFWILFIASATTALTCESISQGNMKVKVEKEARKRLRQEKNRKQYEQKSIDFEEAVQKRMDEINREE